MELLWTSHDSGNLFYKPVSVLSVAVFVPILLEPFSVALGFCIFKKSKNAGFYVLVQVKFWSQLAVSENCVKTAVQPLQLTSIKSLLMVANIWTAVIFVVCTEVFQLKVVWKLGSHRETQQLLDGCFSLLRRASKTLVLLAGLVLSGTCTTVNEKLTVEVIHMWWAANGRQFCIVPDPEDSLSICRCLESSANTVRIMFTAFRATIGVYIYI